MNNNTTPVVFKNKNGLKLHGIMHLPENRPQKKVAVIILSPGIKSRVAPHRLYVKMTERFINLGFPVLRFDFHGLGDSEGEIDEAYAADLYGSIEVGRYVDDTISAMDWFVAKYQIDRFILSGLCGGAITGLLSSAKDERVVGLLELALPVVLASSNVSYDDFLTPSEIKLKRDFYMKKLMSISAWRSWIRFITFQSDYKLIFKSLLFSKKKNIKSNEDKKEIAKEKSNWNPHFIPAFDKFISSKRKLLLVFAEADRFYWQFKEKFLEGKNIDLKKYDNVAYHVINQSNHIFSFNEWQRELFDISEEWLQANF